jgi:release factor glutamine methyltransferase
VTFDDYYKILKAELGVLYDSGEAAAIAGLVLEHFTGKRSRPFTSMPITPAQEEKMQLIQQELLTGKPVQYVLGEEWFLDRKFHVNESVLIPRPETEELVMLAIETLQQKGFQDKPISILDIGTGSGCIAISLALASKAWSVTGIDVSSEALEVASCNSKMLSANVNWQQVDFLDPANWEAFANYEVIVSNPPYIPLAEKGIMEKNVTDWEPSIALFTPTVDPFVFYKAIAAFCKKYPLEERIVLLEGHQNYMADLQTIFSYFFEKVEIRKDINGNERMLLAYI